MKKIIAALFLTISFSAMAEPVFVYPTCNYYGNSGECTVWNTSGKDISCNIQVNGYTQSGKSVSAYDYRILYQGMSAWVRVNAYTLPNDPITSLRANAFCNTLY